MATKPGKESKSLTAKNSEAANGSGDKAAGKGKKQAAHDEDDDLIDDEHAATGGKGTTATAEDEDEDADVKDDWEKEEEEDNWDPDFDEFDLPKSSAKKVGGGKAAKLEEDEDFKVDDEFKDMFNGSKGFDDDEDDY